MGSVESGTHGGDTWNPDGSAVHCAVPPALVEYKDGMTPTSPTLVLIAHGSRAEGTREAHLAVAEQLAARLGQPVAAAFLELSDPDIPTAIDAAVARGATRVVLLPYFLHHGNHTRRDIPAIAASARERHPGVRVEITDPLGPDDALVEIAAARARVALGEPAR